MMELKINVNNHSQNEPYTNLIISMLKQRFSNTEGVSNIDVEINENIDSRVPWLANIKFCNGENECLEAQSASANYLSAFTQALSKLERKNRKAA